MGRTRRVPGYTLVELMVVLAGLGILAAISSPEFAKRRQQARQNACLQQMKLVGMAFVMYCQDYDERLPMLPDETAQRRWPQLVQRYQDVDPVNGCPETKAGLGWDIPLVAVQRGDRPGLFTGPVPARSDCIAKPSQTVLAADGFGLPLVLGHPAVDRLGPRPRLVGPSGGLVARHRDRTKHQSPTGWRVNAVCWDGHVPCCEDPIDMVLRQSQGGQP